MQPQPQLQPQEQLQPQPQEEREELLQLLQSEQLEQQLFVQAIFKPSLFLLVIVQVMSNLRTWCRLIHKFRAKALEAVIIL